MATATVNFGRIITADCVNVPTPVDSRCSDPAFAISNPDICGTASQPALILKPAVALTCALGSIQFKAFTVVNGIEVDVTAQATFTSANLNVAVVGSTSGNATGMAAGETTISATYQGLAAHADFTVLSGDTCCQQQKVAMLVVVDTTKSMSQAFSINYSTKLEFARAAAKRFISEINANKDVIGLADFHGTAYDIVADISNNIAAVEASADTIAQTQDKTEFFDAMTAAIAQLATVSADRKIIVLMSDGQDTLTDAFDQTNDPVLLLNDFKDQGGVVICLGVRASGQGFSFLSAMATGGFFINAFPANESASLDYLSGLKGYICAGNCNPTGDVHVGKGTLDYTNFINWNIDSGNVNLLGNGFFDYLPGNGLYVELTGAVPSFGAYNGRMLSKNTFAVKAGDVYRLTAWLGGNQRVDKQQSVRLRVSYINGIGNTVYMLDQDVLVPDYQQPFQPYAFSFTATVTTPVRISIQQDAPAGDPTPKIGVLLNEVKFEDITSASVLLDDNFDGENQVYLPPACGQGTTWTWLPNLNSYGYVAGYCYSTTCLDNPPGIQQPDPNPLTDIESGVAPPPPPPPPPGGFTSTKTVCLTCPASSTNLVPLVTSLGPVPPPSGILTASSQTIPGSVANLFSGTIGTPWVPTSMPAWVQFQFNQPVTVEVYGFTPDTRGTAGAPTDWMLQGSNDGVTWTTLDTQTGQTLFQVFPFEFKFQVPTPQSFSFIRLLVTGTTGQGGAVPVAPNTELLLYQLQFYGFITGTPSQTVCATATATSQISQADADSKATAAAKTAAQAQLNCQAAFTSTQQFTATCPLGSLGNPNSVTKSATATSLLSQADADAKALAAATSAAEAALSCNASNNTQAIILPADGWNQPFMAPASPCPSVKFVSDAGNITHATVSIFNLQSTVNGDSFIIYLRAPNGTLVLLYYDQAGPGGKAVNGPINLTFDDAALGPVPFNGSPLVSGTYQPSNGGMQPGLVIPPPAPNGPFLFTLAALIGLPKAGAWSLWVGERLTSASSIANGWDITLT